MSAEIDEANFQPGGGGEIQEEALVLKVIPDNSEETNDEIENQYRQFDDLFDHINSFGNYQLLLYGFVMLLCPPLSSQFSALIFAFGTPTFQCTTPNVTCPERTCCEDCSTYAFQPKTFTTTASEWHLVCDTAYQNASLHLCFFAGMLVGSLFSGMVSDAWGRKKLIIVTYIVMAAASVCSAFAKSMALFGVFRFIVGCFLAGSMLTQYVYPMELVGPSKRTMAGTLPYVMISATGLVNAGIAYLIRDWRTYLLVVTGPAVLLFPGFVFMPESPRWLIAHNHLEEAHRVLMRFGGKDGQSIDPRKLKTLIKEIRNDQIMRAAGDKKYTILDLFRTPKMRRWTLIILFHWFVVALMNFGILLFTSQLMGNLYLNVAILSSLGGIKIPLVWLIFLKLGRRVGHGSLMLLVGVTLLMILPFNKRFPITTTVLSILGKIIGGANWNGVYIYTSELFPSVIRNTAQGLGSTSGRIGGMVAPFMATMSQLPDVGVELPAAIFGVLALIAGIMMYWLPETLFAPMHQTIEEAEAATDDYSMPFCRKTLDINDSSFPEIDKEESASLNSEESSRKTQ